MPLSDKMLKQLMATFQAELEEHLSTLNKGLLALEKNPTSEERDNLLTNIFRAAHSLKGASRAVNLGDIEAIAHRMEGALAIIQKEGRPFKAYHVDAFLEALDTISASMTAHVRGEGLQDAIITALLVRLDAVISGEEKPDAPLAKDTPAKTEENLSKSPCYGSPSVDTSIIHSEPATDARLSSPSDSKTPPATQHTSISTGKMGSQQHMTSRPAAGDDTIRVATAKLDTLMGGLGELMVVRMRTEQILEQMKSLQHRTVRWQKNWRKIRPHFNCLRRKKAEEFEGDIAGLLDFLESNEAELKDLSTELNVLMGSLKNDRNYLHLVTDDLQNGIRNARMLPIATLFDIFPRMVRDLARDFGKDIVIEMTGQETEADRQALELMKDPLIHIVRNAVDHGLETPEERLSIGKPRYGTIRICAEQRGNNLVLTVSDDGRGINLEGVRQTAVDNGLISLEKAAELDDKEIVELIFFSGLSTARQVTDISGRGVGMDAVRGNLEQMRGLIQVDTLPGAGTAFTLILPLTLATSHVLLVRVGRKETVALPMMNVERMLRVNPEQIKSIEGYPAIYAEGRPLPLISLSHVLELGTADQPLTPDAKIPVVIVSVVERRIALRVDAFLSTQQVVIKSLGKQLRRVRNIGGVTILGDGQLVTVVNIADVMKSIHTRSVASVALPIITIESRRRVVVVDDSFTTRTLEKHILENAGYDVTALVDGQDAWELIYGNEKALPDLVVSDIDMPRMNGFDLTRAIKGDNRYAHIPVVLVTSLDSPQDRLKGMESGADAYIVKSTFDQRELIEAIERLIR